MLVAPELAVELSMRVHSKAVHQELRLLRSQRDVIDDEIQRYESALRQDAMPYDPDTYAKNMALLSQLRLRRDSLKTRHSHLLAHHHRQFHPVWGQLLKTGHQNSRFAHQMERFACLYTSHVSNLAFVSPDKSYMGRMDLMAHEFEDFAEDSV
jgi:5'-nucleotidase